MSDAKEELDKTKVSFENKWEYIGYHKVLGGFYYQIIFFVLGIAYVMLLPIFVPFPESMGYFNISKLKIDVSKGVKNHDLQFNHI